MKILISTLTLILVFTHCIYLQTKKCESRVSDNSVNCANMVVSYRNIKVRELKGIIENSLNEPINFHVYKISKSESKSEPYNLTNGKTPFKKYETNKNGEFCIKNFPEGHYVLMFGTSDGGWNCTWIIVQVSRNSKDRRIEVSLSIGI